MIDQTPDGKDSIEPSINDEIIEENKVLADLIYIFLGNDVKAVTSLRSGEQQITTLTVNTTEQDGYKSLKILVNHPEQTFLIIDIGLTGTCMTFVQLNGEFKQMPENAGLSPESYNLQLSVIANKFKLR